MQTSGFAAPRAKRDLAAPRATRPCRTARNARLMPRDVNSIWQMSHGATCVFEKGSMLTCPTDDGPGPTRVEGRKRLGIAQEGITGLVTVMSDASYWDSTDPVVHLPTPLAVQVREGDRWCDGKVTACQEVGDGFTWVLVTVSDADGCQWTEWYCENELRLGPWRKRLP